MSGLPKIGSIAARRHNSIQAEIRNYKQTQVEFNRLFITLLNILQ